MRATRLATPGAPTRCATLGVRQPLLFRWELFKSDNLRDGHDTFMVGHLDNSNASSVGELLTDMIPASVVWLLIIRDNLHYAVHACTCDNHLANKRDKPR